MSIPNLLSLSFLVPFVAHKLDFSRAIRGLRGMPRRLLLIGVRLQGNGPQAVQDRIYQNVTTEADMLALFGEGSMLASMWRAAKANAALDLPIDCVAVGPGNSSAAATSTLAIVNDAGSNAVLAQAGELMLYIGGVRVSVGATLVDTQATLATKLIAAINAVPSLPVSASATANTNEVLLTCRWQGVTGNLIDLRTTYAPDDRLPKGVTVTVPAMASGVANPNMTALITGMAGYRATEIVSCTTDSTAMGLLEDEMARRWAFDNMQDGMVVTALRGTESEVTTWLSTRNSPHVHTIVTTRDATSPWETAAMAGAAIESQASTDPALPHTGLPLLGYRGPAQGNHWTITQSNILLSAGGSPLQVAPDSTATLLRMVTNYKRTAQGAADRSMAELAWLKTMSYKRWYTVSEFQTKYSGFKLAQYLPEPLPGQKIMTPELAEEAMLGIYTQFMNAGLCQNMDHYKATLQIEVDGSAGRLKVVDEPVLVTQHYQTEITSFVVGGQV